MKNTTFLLVFLCTGFLFAQKTMTPELLWQVKRVSPIGVSEDGKQLFYKVTTPNMEKNSFDSNYYKMPINGGSFVEIGEDEAKVTDKNISPDGKYLLLHKPVQIDDI